MQTYRVIIDKDALDDLGVIHTEIATDSTGNADAFLAKILDRVDSLASVPAGHRAVGRSRSTGEPVRVTHEGIYLIYYRVTESPARVTVIEVRHGSRRQPRRFE